PSPYPGDARSPGEAGLTSKPHRDQSTRSRLTWAVSPAAGIGLPRRAPRGRGSLPDATTDPGECHDTTLARMQVHCQEGGHRILLRPAPAAARETGQWRANRAAGVGRYAAPARGPPPPGQAPRLQELAIHRPGREASSIARDRVDARGGLDLAGRISVDRDLIKRGLPGRHGEHQDIIGVVPGQLGWARDTRSYRDRGSDVWSLPARPASADRADRDLLRTALGRLDDHRHSHAVGRYLQRAD